MIAICGGLAKPKNLLTGDDSTQAFELAVRIVDMVLFLTCTAVGFWFGSRGTKKQT